MGDIVALSLENSVPQAVISYCHYLFICCPDCPIFGLWELLQAGFVRVLLICLTVLRPTSLFLAQDVLGEACLFHAPVLESAIFPKNPGSF